MSNVAIGTTQYMNSILNNRNENKYYKKIDNHNDIERNNYKLDNISISYLKSIEYDKQFKLDNNFSYKKDYYNDTISSNINNKSDSRYNKSKYTIINKRQVDHNKTKPVYNNETQPTTNPILKRPITIEDIIIKNNLQIKEYNNALIEKRINDITKTHNKAWDMNFSILSNKKKCQFC